MMYRLLNKLFGWDYIWWQNSCDQGIARIHATPDGTVWYWQYRITKLMRTMPYERHHVVWLTCKPEKYLDPNTPLNIGRNI